jgi:RES domain-containing protein
MGRARIAIWRLVYPDKFDIDAFTELFLAELESADAGDIVCCDACYDEYANTWPGITASEDFQSESIDLDWLHSTSELAEVYTKEEFFNLCEEMGCPKCGQPLKYNIWPFNPDFEIPAEFTRQIAEIDKLITRTPFLALTHPLAKRVFDEVGDVAKSTEAKLMGDSLFRARPLGTPQVPEQFLSPPSANCQEGRFNHGGRPVLYLASRREVAFAELDSPKDGVLLADVKLKLPIKVLDLGNKELPSDILRAVTASALVSAPARGHGWDKPEYTFSRFVADCAIQWGFSAIRYPSVKEPRGFNLVVFIPDGAWSEMVHIGGIAIFDGRKEPSSPKT